MKKIVLTLIGDDKPGIVAGITELLFKRGLNIEDSTMTILQGKFAIILLAKLPPKGEFAELKRAAAELGKKLGVRIGVETIKDAAESSENLGKNYIVTAFGADRTGIIYYISRELAKSGVNIEFLETKLLSAMGKDAIYSFVADVVVPPAVSVPEIRKKLGALAKKMSLDISIRPHAQIRM
jgi:glycine cleavage system transcriptional repressor